jgi:hypothetical protein
MCVPGRAVQLLCVAWNRFRLDLDSQTHAGNLEMELTREKQQNTPATDAAQKVFTCKTSLL